MCTGNVKKGTGPNNQFGNWEGVCFRASGIGLLAATHLREQHCPWNSELEQAFSPGQTQTLRTEVGTGRLAPASFFDASLSERVTHIHHQSRLI
jgi:hypothetical protein